MIGRIAKGVRASKRGSAAQKLAAACARVVGRSHGPLNLERLEARQLLSNTIYVDAASPSSAPDGTAWSSAYPNLQTALSVATAGATIEVAQGTYLPGPSSDLGESFTLQNGFTLMGGFAGNTGSAAGINPNARDVSLYPTILSGNLPDPSGGIAHSDNVVTANDVDNTATLDGFVITGSQDAALNLYEGSPNVENCTFIGNSTGNDGGAIYLYGQSSPLIENCSFIDNTATTGGAIFAQSDCDATLQNCDFAGNSALYTGGGIEEEYSSDFTLTNCTFTGNSAEYGGAIYEYDATLSATNTIFQGNSASQEGGAFYGYFPDAPTTVFANCLFAGNSAGQGAAIFNETYGGESVLDSTFSGNVATSTAGAVYDDSSNTTFTNSILYGDGGAELAGNNSTPAITYSDVQGGAFGTGNLNVNPQFVDPSAGEYELQSGSQVIGQGSVSAVPAGLSTDLAGNPRTTGGHVDMGAYEYDSSNPLPALADLQPQNVTAASDTAAFEGTIGLTWTDQNVGNAAAANNWVDTVYLSSSPTLDAASIPLAYPPVAGGGSSSPQDQNLTLTLPAASAALQPGTYYLIVQTDIGDTAGGSNLNDKTAASQAITIQLVSKTIHVDADTPSANPDGKTWATAFPSLQTALAEAEYGDLIVVAQGTYLPTMDGDQNATFYVKDGVSIFGGYGGQELAASGGYAGTYNNTAYVTTLSGDIAGDGVDSYSVVTAYNVGDTTVIGGLTITGATGFEGGGMTIANSSFDINNCNFTNNTVDDDGGGLFIGSNSSPILYNCAFSGNSAYAGGGVYDEGTSAQFNQCSFTANTAQSGGGIYADDNSASFTNSTISGNTASQGGGLYLQGTFEASVRPAASFSGGSLLLSNDFIQNNYAAQGGAIYDEQASPTIVNCLFTGNGVGASGGGAIYDIDSSDPTVINCTFSSNGAFYTEGGAIFEADVNSGAVVTNSILWGDGGSEIVTSDASESVSYSDIQGDYSGVNNINLDPRFSDAAAGDYSLSATSPAIDAGSNVAISGYSAVDLAGNPRIVDTPGINDPGGVPVVDMGAYEYQPSSTFVPLQLPDLEPSNVVPSTLSANFGQTIDISWTDQNIGAYATNGGWTDSIYISTSPQFASLSLLVGSETVTQSLAAGASLNFNDIPFTLPAATRFFDNGTYYLLVQTNATNSLQEFDVQNDVAASAPIALMHIPQTIYVDASSPEIGGVQDGTTWGTAFTDLQTALSDARDGDTIDVAQGVYVPTTGDDPNASFGLVEDVTILGGYGGQTAVLNGDSAYTRNVSAYTTVLSGDLSSQGGAYSNSYTVVSAYGVDNSAVLDGFTITGGDNSNGNGGGGMTVNGSPAISDCLFTANAAVENGGAVEINGGSPVFTDCEFSDNSQTGSGAVGGAVASFNASPIFDGCTFDDNTSAGYGGAISAYDQTLTLTDCTFLDNSAVYDGGAINSAYGNVINATDCSFLDNSAGFGGAVFIYNAGDYTGSYGIANSIFVGNTATSFGGAIQADTDSDPLLLNDTFSGNTGGTGGALYFSDYSSGTVTNSILYGDGPEEIQSDSSSSAAVTYSDVQGGYAGTGNISANPDFVRNPDLSSGDNGDLHLTAASPARNTGEYLPILVGLTDLDGNPRTQNGTVDMGAYEYTSSATTLADLEPSDITTSTTSASFGSTLTVNWTDQNIGTADTTGAWVDDIYLSSTPVLNSSSTLLLQYTTPGILSAGGSENLSAMVNLPAVNQFSDGIYYIIIDANATNVVSESNYQNNVAVSPTVQADNTINWISSTGGDWSVASNWSTDSVPGAGDDAVINVPGITVTISTAVNVNSVNSQANLTVTAGGSLTVTGTGAVVTSNPIVLAGNTAPLTSDLALWLEANQGVVTNGSGDVTAWDDQSGNGFNATPGSGDPTLVSDGINGQPALSFDGTDWLNIAGQVLTSQQFTIFTVVTDTGPVAGSGFREAFSNWDPSNTITSAFLGTATDAAGSSRSVRFTDNIGGALQTDTGVGSVPSDEPFILTGLSGANDADVYLDGSEIYDLGSALPARNLTTGYVIGRQGSGDFENWEGDIAEVLVYNSALTPSQIDEVTAYLAAKYDVVNAAPTPSSITGAFTVDPGGSLTVTGSQTTFTAAGPTVIDGANIEAEAGAQISLPGVTSYTTGDLSGATLQAVGSGSTLSLPNLATINGSTYNFFGPGTLNILASAGGDVELPALTSLPTGNYTVIASGGGLIDMPLLVSIDSTNAASTLEAITGGTITVPVLTSITGVSLTTDATGSINTSQITTFASSTATADGSTLDFNDATDIDASNFIAEAGGTLSVPTAASYSAGDNSSLLFEATGAGSVLSFPDLTTINGSTYNFFGPGTLAITAALGGSIQLPAITTLDAGNYTFNATGGGLINALALTTLDSTNGQSQINVNTNGTFAAPSLTSITGFALTVDSTAVIQTSQITTFTSSAATVTGGTLDFNSATDIDASSFTAEGGAMLLVPIATRYSAGDNSSLLFEATGAGSILSFPDLTTINGSTYNSFGPGTLAIAAALGGSIQLPAITTVNSGNYTFNATGGGLINALALTTLDSTNGQSQINVNTNGTFAAPSLTSITGFALTVDSTAVIQTSQITTFTSSAATVTGGTLDFNSATDIDASSFTAEGGAMLLVPIATRYSAGDNSSLLFEATGAGSILSFPDLTTINGSTYNFFGPGTLAITAALGGSIQLPAITTLDAGNYTFNATGGGLINALALTTLDSTNGQSQINVNTNGTFAAPSLTSITGFALTVDSTAVIQTSQITTFTSSAATVTGGTLDFNSATDIDASSFTAEGGAMLLVPIATRYSAGDNSSLLFEATGAGSILSFPDLTTINGSTYNSFGPGTLAIAASSGGSIELPAITSLNVGNYALNATGGTISAPMLNTIDSTNPESRLIIGAGGSITTAPDLTVTGVEVTLNPTGTLDSAGLTLDAGSILDGSGTFDGDVINNAGTVSPGGSGAAGSISITGVYTQGASAALSIDIGGTTAGTGYDQFNVSGLATLGGTLNVDLIDSFFPAFGNTFSILTAGQVSGQFTTINGNSIGQNTELDPAYGTTSVTLTANQIVGPYITTTSIVSPLTAPFSTIDLTFSKAINPATVVPGQIILTGPNGPISVTSIEQLSPFTFAIGFGPQSADGSYQLAVGPDIQDFAGNDMDQNQNGISGEPSDVYKQSFTVTLPDLVPTITSTILPSAHFGDSLNVTWTDQNTGNASASGGWVDDIYLSTSPTLGAGQIYLLDAVPVQNNPLAAGASLNLSAAITLPQPSANLPVGTYYILIDADATGSVVEVSQPGNVAASSAIVVSEPALPDLAVSNVSSAASADPGQTVTVNWTLTNSGDADAVGPFDEQIFLASDAAGDNPTLLATFTFTGTLAAGSSTPRSAAVQIPTTAVGNEYFVVADNNVGQIYETNTANNTAVAASPINIAAGLSLTLASPTVSDTAGNNSTTATLTRNGDTSSALLVTLQNSDSIDVTAPAQVTIPAGQSSVTFPVSAVISSLAEPNPMAILTAASAGYVSGSATLTVIDSNVPTLTVSINLPSINENVANPAATGTLTTNDPSDTPLVVTLASNTTGKLTVPATVTIPADQTSVTFPVTVIDDMQVDGNANVTVTAAAPGFVNAQAVVDVIDVNVPILTLSLADSSITQNGGPQADTGTITFSQTAIAPFRILLQSSNIGAATVPSMIFVEPGESSVTFPIAAVNNGLAVNQNVTISAMIVTIQGGYLNYTQTSTQLTVVTVNGPALTVTFPVAAISADGTATATVTRNTDTTDALLVTLASSDTTHATVPMTVTIPAGEASATFTVTGVDDMKADGEQYSQISASANGLAEGLATIGVTTVDLPDLTVASVTAPASALAGTQAQISWTILNSGMYATVGSWSDEVFLDPIGGSPSTTPADTVAYTGSPLAAGQSYTQSDTITLPTETGAYTVRIVTDPGQTVEELSFNNNSGAAAQPLNITAPYHATVSTTITGPVPNGTSIPLSGTATYVANGQPAAGVQVAIGIMVNGTVRQLLVTTDSNGNYATTFQPLEYEGGQYSVSADYPGVPNSPPQAYFTIVGMSASPSVGGTVRVVPNTPFTGQFTLTNLTNLPLSGLTASAEDVPGDINVQLSVPQTLPGSGQVTFSYTITADGSQGAQTSAFLLEVTTTQGAFVAIPINVVVTPVTAQLSANPGFLSTGMLVGSQTLVSFTVTNDGGAPSGPLQVLLPTGLSFLSSASPNTLPSLAPGQSTTVSLLLSPDANLALEQYTGSVQVDYTGGALSVPFTFQAISGQTGNVQVIVDDYFTFNTPGTPRVAGAMVSLLDAYDNSIVIASGVTDSTGQVTLTNVPAGPYVLQVQATGHNPYNANYTVTPGITNTDEIILPNQLVTYSWQVVPTEIQDQYSIQLQTTFLTNVPAPVVTITAPANVPTLPPGGSTQINITLTNHGLIAADNVVLNLPIDPEYTFTALTDQLGTLPAQSSVTVPVIVTYNPLTESGISADGSTEVATDGGGGSCTDIVSAAYNFICDNQTEGQTAAAAMSVSGRACDANAVISGFGDIIVYGGPIGGGSPPASVVTNFNCVKCLQAAGDLALNTALGLIPGVGPALQILNNPPKTPQDYIITIGGLIPGPIGGIFGLIGNANDIAGLLNACFGSGGSSVGAAAIFADQQQMSDPAITEAEALTANIEADSASAQAIINYYSYFFGNTDWIATTTQGATEQQWLQDFVNDTAHTSDGSINPADQAQLLATNLPTVVTQADAQAFINRWNLTVAYADQGIFTAAQVPAGQSTDFIDQSVVSQNAAALNQAIIASQANGFTDPVNQLQNAVTQLLNDAENPAVCASVVLQIDQTATLTRDAFAGSLQINNNETGALTNLQVSLDITDADGNPANGEFFIETPTLSGSLTAIDGTGTLAAGSSGGVGYTFIPVDGAANNGPTVYYIGGTITFTDPSGGVVTQTIYPSSITVYPQPNLTIDYFLQRDVIGEDPSDPSANIPSEPAVLGMLVTNTGAGEANNLAITTAQPQIVQNEKGLLDTFQIIGTQVGTQQVTPSLTVDLGDIASGQTADADFLLTSSLQGIFTDFTATFTHSNALGGISTSLISSVNTYDLVHAGDFNFPGSTGEIDYLVDENPNFDNNPDTIFFSNGTTAPVNTALDASASGTVSNGGLSVQVTASVTSGWDYIQLPDPGAGYTLYKVVSSNGTVIPVSDQAWQTDRTFSPDGKSTVDYELHILDFDSTGSYTVYYKPVTTVTPALVSLEPVSSPQTGPVSSIDVTFNEAIAAGTFSLSDVSLVLDGGSNLINSNVTLTQESPTTFTIGNLNGITAADGNYTLTVSAAGVQDLFGDVASGSLSETWATGTDRPVVVSVGAEQPALRNTAESTAIVIFSEPIVASSFTDQSLTLTLNGGSNLINSGVTITQLTDTSYQISGLSPLTAADGNYVLTVNAAALVDANGNSGVGFASEDWTVDTTAPTIVSLSPTPQSPRNIVVPVVDVTFSKPINPASFTYQDITFSNDGGPNLILPTISITELSPTEFEVGNFENLMIPINGTYTFTINAAGVTDLAGNSGAGSASESWVLITSAPAAPANLAITPDTGVSNTDGITDVSSVTLTGTVDEPGLTVEVFDNGTELGDATVTGENFSLPLTLVPGSHTLTVQAIDAAANVSLPSTLAVFYDDVPPLITVSQAPPAVSSTPVDSLQITFSEPVDAADLTDQSLSLSLNGGPNLINGNVTITPVSGNTYEISGLSSLDAANGQYVLTINNADVTDVAGNAGVGTTTVDFTIAIPASVVGQNIFYADSYYDSFGTTASAADDNAIATDKTALLPGQTATFANYTSYVNGINGIMVDISNLAATTLTAGDFTFLVGNNSDPSTWTLAPAPLSVTVRAGAGAGGSDRVEIIWANGVIEDQWLQIEVLADANTGLSTPYVFYFGNAIGDTGNSATDADVNTADVLAARSHETAGPVAITDVYDFNRDGMVDNTDKLIAQDNETGGTAALQLIGPPLTSTPVVIDAPLTFSDNSVTFLVASVSATSPVAGVAVAPMAATDLSAPAISADVAAVSATPAAVTSTVAAVSDAVVAPAAAITVISPAPAEMITITPPLVPLPPVIAPPAPPIAPITMTPPPSPRSVRPAGGGVMEVNSAGRPLAASPRRRPVAMPVNPPSSPIVNDDLLVGVWNAISAAQPGPLFSDILLKD